MVKRYNLSPAFGNPPSEGAVDSERKIAKGPLYPKADVLKLLVQVSIELWTRKCQKEVRDLDLDLPGVAYLITEAIQRGKYTDSEWCVQNPTGPWAACDVYLLTRKEWNSFAYKEMAVDYFFKFSLSEAGKLLLVASCHTQH